MHRFSEKIKIPKGEWKSISVYFNWDITDDLHVRLCNLLQEFHSNEPLSKMLVKDVYRREDIRRLTGKLYLLRTGKNVETIFSLSDLSLLYRAMEFIVVEYREQITSIPEKLRAFDEFYARFFNLISLGCPMPSALDSLSSLIRNLPFEKHSPEIIRSRDVNLYDGFKADRDFTHPDITQDSEFVLIELSRPYSKILSSTHVMFRWFVRSAAHDALLNLINTRKAELTKILEDPASVDALAGILRQVNGADHIGGIRMAVFPTPYSSVVALLKVCHQLNQSKLSPAEHAVVAYVLSEFPGKLPLA